MNDNKHFIICVDDEISILETLSEQLLFYFGKTHEVITCQTAEEALSIIGELNRNNELISLVISDQIMPGMKGDELLAKVHQQLPDTIKILLTGYAGLDSAIKSINEGNISRYIQKPWDMETIHADLTNLLQKYKQTIENAYLLKKLIKHIDTLDEHNLDSPHLDIDTLKVTLDEHNLDSPHLDIDIDKLLDETKA